MSLNRAGSLSLNRTNSLKRRSSGQAQNLTTPLLSTNTSFYRPLNTLPSSQLGHLTAAINTKYRYLNSEVGLMDSDSDTIPMDLSSEVASQDLNSEVISQDLSSEVISQDLSSEVISQDLSSEVISQDLSSEVISQDLSSEVISQDLSSETIVENLNEQKQEKVFEIDENAKETIKQILNAESDFDIEKCTLAVGKEVAKNDKFKNLSKENQKLVLIAILMRDMTKIETKSNTQYLKAEAQFTYSVLKDVLNEKGRKTVANLIFNYNNFIETLNSDYHFVSQLFGFECIDENPQFIDMLQVLSEVKLQDRRINQNMMPEKMAQNVENLKIEVSIIDKSLKTLKEHLELTPFPQKIIDKVNDDIMQEYKDKGIVGEFKSQDIKIPKIDLARLKELPSQEQKEFLHLLGFNNGVKYNNLEFLIHAIVGENDVDDIACATDPDIFKPDFLLSTSIIAMANPTTFENRKFGFIMEPDSTSILCMSPSNINSGAKKLRKDSCPYIEYKNTSVSNDPFAKFDNDYSYITNYIEASREKKLNGNSELITVDNKVSAIFVKAGHENEMPEQLVKFANERKLPLIIIPDDQG